MPGAGAILKLANREIGYRCDVDRVYAERGVKNGLNNSEVFAIDANVLTVAKQVLDLSLSHGSHREYQAGLNPGDNNSGYQLTEEKIVEGEEGPLNKSNHIEHYIRAKVNIHSHPTGVDIIDGLPYSIGADMPSEKDKQNTGDVYEMSIIVGKRGTVQLISEKAVDGSTSEYVQDDTREAEINIYDKDRKEKPAMTISEGEVNEILEGYENR